MPDSSLAIAVIASASSLFGTALGIGGTLFVQLRVERQKQEYDKAKEARRRQQEKLEEFVSLLHDHDEYVSRLYEINVLQRYEIELPSPIGKLRAIAYVHCRELQSDVSGLSIAAAALKVQLIEAFWKLKQQQPINQEKIGETYNDYLDASAALLLKVDAHLKENEIA